jgi:hypothetical protein
MLVQLQSCTHPPQKLPRQKTKLKNQTRRPFLPSSPQRSIPTPTPNQSISIETKSQQQKEMSYKPATTALVTGWFGCGVAATAVPVLIFWFSRVQHQAEYGQAYQNYQNQYGYMEVDNGSNKPWWYFGSSVQERQEPGGVERETSPVLLAAYLWSLTLFLGILFYGYVALRNNTSTEGVFVALLMFAAYSFISLVVFGSVEGGAVQTEGRMVDEHGFAGQFAVMVR